MARISSWPVALIGDLGGQDPDFVRSRLTFRWPGSEVSRCSGSEQDREAASGQGQAADPLLRADEWFATSSSGWVLSHSTDVSCHLLHPSMNKLETGPALTEVTGQN